MNNDNVAKALDLYKKNKLATGGMPELQLEQMKATEPVAPDLTNVYAPLNVDKTAERDPLVINNGPAPETTEDKWAGVAKAAAPYAAGAIGTALGGPLVGKLAAAGTGILTNVLFGADGGMVEGGMVGSFASLTDAINAKEEQSGFPQPTKQNELKDIEPDVSLSKPKAYQEGGEVKPPDAPAAVDEALTPSSGARKPLAADNEAEGRAKELDTIVREIDTDIQLDENEKGAIRSQAYRDAATRGMPATALRANFLLRKGQALERLKAKAPAKAEPAPSPEAPKAEEAPKGKVSYTLGEAKPVAAAPVAAPKAEEAQKAEEAKPIRVVSGAEYTGYDPATRGSLIMREGELKKKLGDKAYTQYLKYLGDAMEELGGLNTAPSTAEDFARNKEIFKNADSVALVAAEQYAKLFPPTPTTPAAEVKAAVDTTGKTAADAGTTDASVPTDSTDTTGGAGATPSPQAEVVKKTEPAAEGTKPAEAVNILEQTALEAGMNSGEAKAFATRFAPLLGGVDATQAVEKARELIATDPTAAAAIKAGKEIRTATTAKLKADEEIITATQTLDDAVAELKGSLAIDIQRRLAAAQMNGDRLRREIADGISQTERYMKTTTPGAISSILGIMGAGMGSQSSYQDWYRKKVKEELQAQYDLLGKKQTLLGLYLDQTKDLDAAYKLTEASIQRVLAAQTQAVASKSLSERAKAEATIAAKKLELDAAKTEEGVITAIASREHAAVSDALDRQRAELALAKEVLDTFQSQKLADISAKSRASRGGGGAATERAKAEIRAAEKAGPAPWQKAVKGQRITLEELGEIKKWDDKKSEQFVPVYRPVITRQNIGGRNIEVYSLAPSPGLFTLALSKDDAKAVKASNENTASMLAAWNTMYKLAAKHGFSGTALKANGPDTAEYDRAIQAVIAGYSQLYKTGVISGGEYERYKEQADGVNLLTRKSVGEASFPAFNRQLKQSNDDIRNARLLNPPSSVAVDISKIPAGHIAGLKANPSKAADFDSLYGAGAADAVLGR